MQISCAGVGGLLFGISFEFVLGPRGWFSDIQLLWMERRRRG